MNNLAIRILTILGWVASTVFLFSSPRIESLIGYFVASSALLGLEWFGRRALNEDPRRAHDAELLEQFKRDLPYEPSIAFLHNHHFGASFSLVSVAPIDDFSMRWTDAAHEFLDKRLDTKKRWLVQAGRVFADLVGQSTWPIAHGAQSVKATPDESPAAWEERARHLNERSSSVVDAHQDLTKEGVRWATRKPVSEALAFVAAAVVLALPAASFALNRIRDTAVLRLQLGHVEFDRDSLAKVVRQLEAKLAGLPPPSHHKSLRGVRERLGAFLREADSLAAKPHVGMGVSGEESRAWRERVSAYLRRSGLDSSFEAEFMSAAPDEDEDTWTSRMTEAMRKRRAVLIKFLDKFRTLEDL